MGKTHENDHKTRTDEYLVMTLTPVLGIKVVVNRPGTPKLWVLDYENGHITRKRRVSGHISQTCKGSYEASKSS